MTLRPAPGIGPVGPLRQLCGARLATPLLLMVLLAAAATPAAAEPAAEATPTMPAAPTPATPELAREQMLAFVTAKDLPTAGVVIDNGSGLSRHGRMPVDFLRRLLQSAWHSTVMPEFIASLPLLGRDGTAKKRLPDSDTAGRAHLKTGSLEGVRGLAGYLQATSGRRYVFVALINHPRAAALQPCIDSLIESLIRSEQAPPFCWA